MTRWQKIITAIAWLYMAVAVITFGPAMVDAEKEDRRALNECKTKQALTPGRVCFVGDSAMFAVAKAAVWPLYWSYSVAKQADKQSGRCLATNINKESLS